MIEGAAFTFTAVGLAGATALTFYYAGRLDARDAEDGPGDTRTTRAAFDEDDALERACCFVCPTTGKRYATMQPDAITYDVDRETWTTDHVCPCGGVHRYHHDGDESVYDRDVSQPGGGQAA